jgi:murein DD-endopeptidase MepM/ murein hydrolase activator NlpD
MTRTHLTLRRMLAACALVVAATTPAYGRTDWTDPVAGMTLTCGFLDPNYIRTPCRANGTQDARDSWRQHLGADFRASAGTRVVAPVSGQVVLVNASASTPAELSYLVIRDSATREEHGLGHVTSTLRVGATVNRGDPVGTVANWGSNSHLHWGFNTGSVATAMQRSTPCLRGGVTQSCPWGWGKAPYEATEQQVRSQGWRNVL